MLLEGKNKVQVARELGVSRTWVKGWTRSRGLMCSMGPDAGLTSESRERARVLLERLCGVDPRLESADQRSYVDARGQLNSHGRGVLFHLLLKGKKDAQIARVLGTHRGTIGREIARNGGRDSYLPQQAQQRAARMAARPKVSKLAEGTPLRCQVAGRLNRRDSPEQISARMRLLFPDDEGMNVSHETIYQALYVQGKGALRHELTVEKALRSGRTSRRPTSKLPRRGNKSWIGADATISDRPAEVADRAVPGHWEGDLVLGKANRTALITLVERTSRFVLIRRLPERHDGTTVADALVEMIKDLPEQLRRTMTWDRGSEMSEHATFTLATDTKVYFCDPYSPWQRGSNENTNGLIRDFFPKGTDFSEVTDEEIRYAQDNLNARIRKTLGWKTPTDILNTSIGVALTT
ncbi:IS30 family transposase [Dietzia sp. 2505]|uniref:IS30 family transposase n=1 Tax=Dietzia sp. 2505 TaxID=3156457 RepID=UPI00339AA75F